MMSVSPRPKQQNQPLLLKRNKTLIWISLEYDNILITSIIFLFKLYVKIKI